MNWLEKKELKGLLLELARVPSISGTAREADMVEKLTEVIGRIPYFQENPGCLYVNPLEGDPLGRSYLAALLRLDGGRKDRNDVSRGKEGRGEKSGEKDSTGKGKGEGCSRKTVILLNHFDVVDILDYGGHRELAFKPLELTAALQKEKLPPAVSRDLEEGDYLFGRGIADMKAGIALQLGLLQQLADQSGFRASGGGREEAEGGGGDYGDNNGGNEGSLEGNILFLSVPDEETSSRGAVECIPFLNKLREEEGLEYRAVINCEPVFPEYPGDRGNYLYTGSTGKGLVMFYCYGKETHVGDSLSGLNGNLLASEIIRQLEGNVEFCDRLEGITAPPPSCLKQQDFKRLYSAQIPHDAAAYFNVLLLTSGPGKVLEEMKGLAEKAFKEVLNRLGEMRRRYFKLRGRAGEEPDPGWEPRVFSYGEFYRRVYAERGEELRAEVAEIYERYSRELGQQELALRVVSRVQELSADKEPKIVVGFLPPYYPPVVTTGADERERRLLKTAAGVIELAAVRFGEEIKIHPSFSGISDLSYFKLADYQDAAAALKPNMPGWGVDYRLPLEEMTRLNLPVMNLSIPGRDAHKWQERLELGYYLKVLPALLRFTVAGLLGD